LAELLKVEEDLILKLVHSGQMRGYLIGTQVRIREDDLASYLEQAVAANAGLRRGLTGSLASSTASEPEKHKCPTFGGQSTFTYLGSVLTGTTIWPSKKANYKMQFDAGQWASLLESFRGKEVRAGLNFSQPEEGSFGDWIKRNWHTKMGPAAYVGGILIAEGYAARPRPGWIRVFEQRSG
jgi:excisionase family DNA binding protein